MQNYALICDAEKSTEALWKIGETRVFFRTVPHRKSQIKDREVHLFRIRRFLV